jgi:hypothetical protein
LVFFSFPLLLFPSVAFKAVVIWSN